MKHVIKLDDKCADTLDNVKNYREFKLMEKLNNGEKLEREDMDYLTGQFRDDGEICKNGWGFDFKPFMKHYMVKYAYIWHELLAFDAACFRNDYYTPSCITRIIEFQAE